MATQKKLVQTGEGRKIQSVKEQPEEEKRFSEIMGWLMEKLGMAEPAAPPPGTPGIETPPPPVSPQEAAAIDAAAMRDRLEQEQLLGLRR
jgi:hypothetical protein